MLKSSTALAAGVFLFVCGLPAQKKFVLSIDNIMRGSALYGYEPSGAWWSGDSKRVYFQWKQAADPVLKPMDTYVANRDGSGLRKLSEEEVKAAPPSFGDISKDRKQTVFTRDGDLFIYDRPTDKLKRLTKTIENEANPHFTPDGKQIWFTRANNLYLLTLDGGMLEQLSDIRRQRPPPHPEHPPRRRLQALVSAKGKAGEVQQQSAQSSATGEPQKGTDSQEFIKKEEKELLDIISQKAAKREEDEARRKRDNPRKPFTLQARQVVAGLSLSPDGKTVIASIVEPGERAKTTIVPNFVTESAYTEDIASRGQGGRYSGADPHRDDQRGQRRVEVRATSARSRRCRSPRLRRKLRSRRFPSRIPPSRIPLSRKDAAAMPPTRDIQLSQPVWSEDGTKAVLLARAGDNKDRWILALDPATGKTRRSSREHDEAWVGGPGAFTFGWMGTIRTSIFSPRSPATRTCTRSLSRRRASGVDSGKWEVQTVRLSEDKSTILPHDQ